MLPSLRLLSSTLPPLIFLTLISIHSLLPPLISSLHPLLLPIFPYLTSSSFLTFTFIFFSYPLLPLITLSPSLIFFPCPHLLPSSSFKFFLHSPILLFLHPYSRHLVFILFFAVSFHSDRLISLPLSHSPPIFIQFTINPLPFHLHSTLSTLTPHFLPCISFLSS